MRLMKPLALALLTLCVTAAAALAQEMPKPTAEHAWLKQFVGEWTTGTEAVMEPGKPPVQSAGTERVRAIGDFWIVTEVTGDAMGQPFTGLMTLGYDTSKQKYVGTWIDSMTGAMWQYEGTLNAARDTLTLESEGECPMRPGQQIRFRETLTLKDANHKVFSSAMQDEKTGDWVTVMTSRAERR